MDAPKKKVGQDRLDEALLRRVRDREPAAMSRFFEHFHDRVYGYLASLLRDSGRAEDLAQETFLRLHESLDRLDPKRDPAPWVFTVASNLVRDHWRSREHRDRKEQAGLDEIGLMPATETEGDAQVVMERQETARTLRKAMASLSIDDLEITILRTYEQMEFTQISEVLGIGEDAARQRHSRALKRLGEQFRRIEDAE